MQLNKVISAKEAAHLVTDGSTIAVTGCENQLLPDKVLQALEERYLKTGQPKDLTEFHPVIYGMGPELGLEHFAHEGMVSRSIGSGFSFLKTSRMTRMVKEGKLQAYVVPMGTMYQLLQNAASGLSYTLTKVGLNTFVDPRIEGGCMNNITPNNFVELAEFKGEPWLCYRTPKIDVAIIRGTTADKNGNLSLEDEPLKLGILTMAMAAKASGGKVIAQVRRVARTGSLNPRSVVVPGIFIDAVVVDEEQMISGGKSLNPFLTGEVKMALSVIEPLPLNIEKVILRRAAQEIKHPPQVVNLGVGIPVGVPRILLEEGREKGVTFFPEHGSLGGVPGDRSIFGTNINPDAIIDPVEVFERFRGGGLDITFLGCGQVDSAGNVNVSKFNGIVPGCGGFIDITYKTPRIVFCGSFTSGGLEASFDSGKLVIQQEGKYRKLVTKVEQITLSAKNALENGQDVTYVTERAVFKLGPNGLILTEIAPGVDLQTDILDLVEFKIKIVPNLKIMDTEIFC